MSWDLNDEKFNEDSSVEVDFITQTGEVGPLTADVVRKTDEEHENAPDYKIVLENTEGKTTSIPFYYFKEGDDEKRYGKKLTHVARCFLGDTYTFPKFADAKEMLDTIMKLVKKEAPSIPVKVFINYGTIGYPKAFPTVRTFVPFIKRMEDAEELVVREIDNMTRPTPDNETTNGFSNEASTSTVEVEDDWEA